MGQVPVILRSHFRWLCQGNADWPLLLYGGVGTGKTCGALALCDYCDDTVYATADRLADGIWPDDQCLWRRLREAALVVIDELGTREKVNDRQYTAVKQAADARDMRPTIWISNLTPEQLVQAYDDRVVSRIARGTVLELEGDDQRMTC